MNSIKDKYYSLLEIFKKEDVFRILSSVNNIALVEYKDPTMHSCIEFAEVLEVLNISSSIVKHIVCVSRQDPLDADIQNLRSCYASAKITNLTTINSSFRLPYTLAIHFAQGHRIGTLGYQRAYNYFQNSRHFYNIIIDSANNSDETGIGNDENRESYEYCIQDDIDAIQFAEKKSNPEPSEYCKSRAKQIEDLMSGSYQEAAFHQCLKEVENGCQECNMCSQYQSRRLCPLFQHKIAEFYRNGCFVPHNDEIAHNWDLMSSNQGYDPAKLLVAEDLIFGIGCETDSSAGIEILADFVDKGNEPCAERIVELATDSMISPEIGSKYLLMLANKEGDSCTQWKEKVAECFSDGSLGFPKDSRNREKWELRIAESGDIRAILTIAQKYYEDGNWQQALLWYNRLQQKDSETDYSDTIDSIFEQCIYEENLTPQQIAEKGRRLYLGLDCEEDPATAIEYFKAASDQGNAMAMSLIADSYESGRGVAKDSSMAEQYHRRAAEAGDVESMVWMHNNTVLDFDWVDWGRKVVEALDSDATSLDCRSMLCKARLLYNGELLSKNKEESHAIYERVKLLYNDPEADYYLGVYYYDEFDKSRAFDSFLCSAKHGYLLAQRRVGMCYYEGEGVPKDFSESVKWLSKAAARGDQESQLKLYVCYASGNGVNRNMTIANQWCLKAAEQGMPRAEAIIGENYYTGNGINKDYAMARKWLELASSHGQASAYFRTAWMAGSGEGGAVNHALAFSLYLKLAESGIPVAMNNLACMYSSGQGTARDERKAAEWYLKSAEAGNRVAQCNIANYYRDGKDGIVKDSDKAVYWYEKSLSNRYSYAAYFLARMFRFGQGVVQDLEKSFGYYEQAIAMPHSDSIESRGYCASIIELADLYYDGKEVEEDDEKAFSLYRQAAEVNITKALLRLGNCYEYGYGVAGNIENAVFWYRKAAAAGDIDAKQRLNYLGYDYIGNN